MEFGRKYLEARPLAVHGKCGKSWMRILKMKGLFYFPPAIPKILKICASYFRKTRGYDGYGYLTFSPKFSTLESASVSYVYRFYLYFTKYDHFH